MKKTIYILTCIGMAACANFPQGVTQANAPNERNGLAAQKLAQGQCGVFFWDQATPRTFVFFQKIGDMQAEFFHEKTKTTLSALSPVQSLLDAPSFNIEYQSGGVKTAIVKGQFSEPLDGGQRIAPASITLHSKDGWQEIIPVSGAYVCR